MRRRITAPIDSPPIPRITSCVYLYDLYSVAQPCPNCALAIPSRIAESRAGVQLVSGAARSGPRNRGVQLGQIREVGVDKQQQG
jgi:hypothetical protein